MKIQNSLLGAGLLLAGSASAATNVACVGSAGDLTNALAGLSTSSTNTDADEIRIMVGSYAAPAGGWTGTVTTHHDLTVRGGYLDAACAQQTLDASMTVLDGNDAAGVLTIETPLGPDSNIEVSGLTFQHGSGMTAFNSSAGGLKIGDPNPISNGNILIERNIFRNNSGNAGFGSHAVGGLLAATDGESLIVRGNLFANNSAPNAAAAYLFSNNEIDVSNNTFTGNQSLDTDQPTRVMLGFFTLAGMNLSNNIFWGNSVAKGVFDIDLSGEFAAATLVNNDIESSTGTAASAAGTLHAAPDFAGAGNFRLTHSSPLIDAGMGDPTGGSTGVDLDGAPRIDGSAIDVGAYESSFLFVDGFD
jgi:hypothetical protein